MDALTVGATVKETVTGSIEVSRLRDVLRRQFMELKRVGERYEKQLK